MTAPFVEMGRARMRSLDRGRQEQEQEQARTMREIQRRALEMSLERGTEQRDWQRDDRFREQAERAAAGHQRSESIRRRRALLAVQRPDLAGNEDALTALAEDDTAFGQSVRPEQPRNPIVGSPEWEQAERTRAGISRQTHQSNRMFDVQNPTSSGGRPVVRGGSYSFGNEPPPQDTQPQGGRAATDEEIQAALQQFDGDIKKATEYLRQQGLN